jgi:hypothetical protein
MDRRAQVERDQVPSVLDHILLGCAELQHGIDVVEQQTGVRARFGGVHPGRGTQNALLSLGERHYLEIIAPDPKQAGAPDRYGLRELSEPRPVGWAAHPGSLEEFAVRLTREGIAFEGPTPGSRQRPDGRRLEWSTLTLNDDAGGLLPFFIEWHANSLHPSVDAPQGCRVLSFKAATPDLPKVGRLAAKLGLELPIIQSETPRLSITLAGPKGQFVISS